MNWVNTISGTFEARVTDAIQCTVVDNKSQDSLMVFTPTGVKH